MNETQYILSAIAQAAITFVHKKTSRGTLSASATWEKSESCKYCAFFHNIWA